MFNWVKLSTPKSQSRDTKPGQPLKRSEKWDQKNYSKSKTSPWAMNLEVSSFWAKRTFLASTLPKSSLSSNKVQKFTMTLTKRSISHQWAKNLTNRHLSLFLASNRRKIRQVSTWKRSWLKLLSRPIPSLSATIWRVRCGSSKCATLPATDSKTRMTVTRKKKKKCRMWSKTSKKLKSKANLNLSIQDRVVQIVRSKFVQKWTQELAKQLLTNQSRSNPNNERGEEWYSGLTKIRKIRLTLTRQLGCSVKKVRNGNFWSQILKWAHWEMPRFSSDKTTWSTSRIKLGRRPRCREKESKKIDWPRRYYTRLSSVKLRSPKQTHRIVRSQATRRRLTIWQNLELKVLKLA